MKKSLFLLWLLTTTISLTACGSKNFNMTFEEALETANHSEFQDILSQNDNFEQSFDIAGKYNTDEIKVDAKISSNSKQNLVNKNSESSTDFNANITSSGETTKLNWTLDIKLANDAIYLNISSFELTWSDDLAMIEMIAAGFKNQWFSIPMSGLNDMPNTFSMLKDSKDLNDKSKEIFWNEWFMIYSWKFTQFEWYNARKFSIDNEKLNGLMKEYYDSISSGLDEDSIQETPEINIQNFEWYLVITWKHKVTTVIENMEMKNDEDASTLVINWFAGEDTEINISQDWESIIKIIADKKGPKYNVSITMPWGELNWTVSPKLSKSSIKIGFDLKLTIKSEENGWKDTVIPLKGSWTYNTISEFTTTIPENAQDLTELLSSYLWSAMGWNDYEYDEDYDYENLYNSEELEDTNTEWLATPVENPEEATE